MAQKKSFTATIEDWCEKIEGAADAIFRESAQAVAEEADQILVQYVYAAPVSPSGYNRTGFLRSSLMASTSQMPMINPAAKPVKNGSYTFDAAAIEAVIAGAEWGGPPIYMGYIAAYSAMVHYGANGTSPKPWVTMTAQNWQMIVNQKTAELKSRLGL